MAHRHGRPFLEVVRQPWIVTLVTYAMIVDAERIEGVRAELEEQRAAQRFAIAFHEPKRLWSEARLYHANLVMGTDRTAPEVVQAEAERLIAKSAALKGGQSPDGN